MKTGIIVPYGPSKYGKTVDALYSFPCGLFIGKPDALQGCETVVGYSPKIYPDTGLTIDDLTELLLELSKSGIEKFDAIIGDDLSLIVEKTVAKYEAKSSGVALWGLVRKAMLRFRDAAEACKVPVIMTAHAAEPKIDASGAHRGGPKLPGRMVEDLPTVCTTVLRAAIEPGRTPWPLVYKCGTELDKWVTGDRLNVAYDGCPGNLAELLRSGGYTIRRAPGLEWQDEVVEKFAGVMANGLDRGLLPEMKAAIMEKYTTNMKHVRWTLRDIVDRVVIRKAQQQRLETF